MIKYNQVSVDENVFRAGVELLVPLWQNNNGRFGSIDQKKWLDFSDWMKSEKLISSDLEINKTYKDFSYILR